MIETWARVMAEKVEESDWTAIYIVNRAGKTQSWTECEMSEKKRESND